MPLSAVLALTKVPIYAWLGWSLTSTTVAIWRSMRASKKSWAVRPPYPIVKSFMFKQPDRNIKSQRSASFRKF